MPSTGGRSGGKEGTLLDGPRLRPTESGAEGGHRSVHKRGESQEGSCVDGLAFSCDRERISRGQEHSSLGRGERSGAIFSLLGGMRLKSGSQNHASSERRAYQNL